MTLMLHTETTIDSCHKLEEYDGKCAFLHGHTWKIELWFSGEETQLDKVGILVDFGIVKELKEVLDHKYLNDIIGMNPTAELLTLWIYKWLNKKIHSNQSRENIQIKVRVYETAVDKLAWCEYGFY